MFNIINMLVDATDQKGKLELERDESIKSIEEILSTAEYDLNELSEFDNPQILVMGTGPYIPEAHVVKEWAESNRKSVVVTCVEKDDNDPLFMENFLKLEESEYFKLKIIKSTFEEYPFDQNFSLILLLRQPTLSSIADSVYGRIPYALSNNGIFIMSGGYNNQFGGYSLKQPNFSIEKKTQVLWSNTDFYKIYSGENTVFKFRKNTNGI